MSEHLLKRYMMHVYKWTGKFEFEKIDGIFDEETPDGQLMIRLSKEIESRADTLAENITEGTLQA